MPTPDPAEPVSPSAARAAIDSLIPWRNEASRGEARKLDKNRIIERLVLERTISGQFCRLLVFLLQLFIFILNLQQFYPSTKINLAHKSISGTLGLGDMPTGPTGAELLEFLQDVNGKLSTMAPNSKAWVADPQMRKLLPDPRTFTITSPEYLLAVEEEPELTADFTVLVWVRSSAQAALERLGPLVSKRQDGLTCWQIHAEYFAFGGHEGDLRYIYHPRAQDMYHPRATPAALWPESRIREIQDDTWHHVGVQVDGVGQRLRFVVDGTFEGGWYALPRGLTDCRRGQVIVGSAVPSAMFDLQWFPTLLTQEEIGDVQKYRTLLQDLVAGAGADPPESSLNSATLTKLEEISRSISLTPGEVTGQMQDVLKKVVKSVEGSLERVETSVKAKIKDDLSGIETKIDAMTPRQLVGDAAECEDDDPVGCNQLQYEYIFDQMRGGGEDEATIACITGEFNATFGERPAALYTRLLIRKDASATPTFCETKRADILSNLDWMDYQLCYTGGTAGYTTCRRTCGFCYLNPAKFPAADVVVPPFQVGSLDGTMSVCRDDPLHEDSTGSTCQWYFSFGPPGDPCASADASTRDKCRMTCECARNPTLDMAVADFNKDGVLSASELRSTLWEHFVIGAVYGGGTPGMQLIGSVSADSAYSKRFTELRQAYDFYRACEALYLGQCGPDGHDGSDACVIYHDLKFQQSFGPATVGGWQWPFQKAVETSGSDQAALDARVVELTADRDECVAQTRLGLQISSDAAPALILAREALHDVKVATVKNMLTKVDQVHNPVRNQLQLLLDDAVRNIGSDTAVTEPISLTHEPVAAHFPVCENHAACDRRVLACPPSDPDCPFKFEGWGSSSIFKGGWGFFASLMGQRQFCARTCMTGGCGEDSAEPPAALGSPGFCQPCGACTENPIAIDDACPSYCDEFKRNDAKSGTFAYDFPETAEGTWDLPMNPYDDSAGRKFPGGELRNPVSGGLHFEFWVRDPAPKWNIRKRFPEWEDSAVADEKCKPLEPSGGGKVCWGFHLEGFCYRTSWNDKLRHVDLGDFREKLTDGKWHQITLRQEVEDRLANGESFWYSADKDDNKRLTTSILRFYVDGQEVKKLIYNAHGNPEVGAAFFADCAGQMTAITGLKTQSAALTYAATAPPPSKVVFGNDHSAVLTFSGVPVPPEAVVMSAQLELLPSLFETQDKSTVGQGGDVTVGIGVSLSSTCGAGSDNALQWKVKRDAWETKGLLAECAHFQTPCSPASPVLSVDFAAELQKAIREPGFVAGGDISVHLIGETARCDGSTGSPGAARPLVLNALLGAFLSGGEMPKLRVKYCLNAACVSPRFMGSGALLTAPTLSVANEWNYRRLQEFSLRSELVLGPGVVTGLRFLSDKISDRVMQRGFYNSLAVLSTVEPPVRIPTERARITVPPLPSQVVLIAPPVILQTRSKEIPCESSLAGDITGMLAQQLDRKCSLSYSCDAMTALSERLRCFNREEDESEEDYFGEEAKNFGEKRVYADFANVLRETTVLKNGDMLSVGNWIDQKTASVSMIAVFSIAYNSITTVLKMTWTKHSDDGSGRLSGEISILSYRNIPPEDLNEFLFYIIVNMFLNIMDIFVIGSQVMSRRKKQSKLLDMVAGNAEDRKVIKRNLKVLPRMDVFDLAMRIAMTGLCVQFFRQKYYSTDTDAGLSLSPLDQQGQDLMTIDWTGPEGRAENNQFTNLFKIVSSISQGQEEEFTLRKFAFFTLFFMLIRIIIYMNCHPRIAVLYGTIVQSMDDLVHFAIVFVVIFYVFAFSASWAIGSDNDKFENVNKAMVTQFEMITGSFPFNEQPGMLELFYTIAFVSVVFIIMVNTFLLAVVVEAYSGVAQAIKDSVVEQNVFLDVIESFGYFYFRFSRSWKWPDRNAIVAALAAEDFDGDGMFDNTDATEEYEVTMTRLASLKNLQTGHVLFPDERTAKDWIDYYLWLTPSVAFGYEETPPLMLMHQQEEATVTKIAWITKLKMNADKRVIEETFHPEHRRDSAKSKEAEAVANLRSSIDDMSAKLQAMQAGDNNAATLPSNSTVASGVGDEGSAGAVSAGAPELSLPAFSRRLTGVEGQLQQVLAGQDELRQMLMKIQSATAPAQRGSPAVPLPANHSPRMIERFACLQPSTSNGEYVEAMGMGEQRLKDEGDNFLTHKI